MLTAPPYPLNFAPSIRGLGGGGEVSGAQGMLLEGVTWPLPANNEYQLYLLEVNEVVWVGGDEVNGSGIVLYQLTCLLHMSLPLLL